MAQSLVHNLIHLVFSTKHREDLIPQSVMTALYSYQTGIFREWECPVLSIGGTENHIHVLFLLSKNHALCKIVEEVKKGSSKWMKTKNGTDNHLFAWQHGYAGFSVSESNVEKVRNYIEAQEQHHARIPFKEELLSLLVRHGIDYDEKYLWE